MDRLTATDYYGAAFDVLAAAGGDGLTIATMCDQLQVTKGSFYHHFDSMPGFVTGLIDYWAITYGDRVIAAARAERDPQRRLDQFVDLGLDLPHAAEAAIRAWARSRPDVAEVVARVDKRRERYLTDAMAALGIERARARMLAQLGLDLVIGAQHRAAAVDGRSLQAVLVQYLELLRLEIDAVRPGRRRCPQRPYSRSTVATRTR